MTPPRFSPEINFGQIVMLVGFLLGMAGSVAAVTWQIAQIDTKVQIVRATTDLRDTAQNEAIAALIQSQKNMQELFKDFSAIRSRVDTIANDVSNIQTRLDEAILPAAREGLDRHERRFEKLEERLERLHEHPPGGPR